MANEREIKNRIKSINDTLKITNAMYLISSSKLKKAKKMLEDTEPYFYTLQNEMTRILRHLPDVEDKYFRTTNGVKSHRAGFIVVTADKGLAGAYNHNVLKGAEELIKEHKNAKLFVLGECGRHYFETKKIPIDKQFHYTVQNPTLSRARTMTEELLPLYKKGKIDEIYLIYTRMKNAVEEVAETVKLLPLDRENFKAEDDEKDGKFTNISFKPSPVEVMDNIVPEFLVGFIYGALVEAYSCEQNARMTAMKAASDSARDMLKTLNVEYNRARQAAITQMITEVAAGAKAQGK